MLRKNSDSGFSLLELAVVVTIIAVVSSMAMFSGIAVVRNARQSGTEQKLAAIEKALQDFRNANDRLPCPADITIADGATNYGVEAANSGTCTGGTPAANNSAAGVTNTYYTGVEGALPVATLGLANDMMYDAWGFRFRYAVDKGLTATAAFSNVGSACTNRAITIKDSNGNAITSGAVYAVISHGENGHGSYTKTGVISNANSSNTDELTNCHCTSAAAAGTYAPTYVQKSATTNTTDATNSFDDLVTYKERWQMLTKSEKPQACPFVFVTDYWNHRVQKFDTGGNFIAKWGSNGSGNGQFNRPWGIVVDSNNYVYISDFWNGRIQKFDSNGTYITKWNTSSAPMGLTLDASGNVLVGEQWSGVVEKFSNTGTLLSTMGSTGSGDGQFGTNTAGVAVKSTGEIYVTDPSNHRIQKFSSGGTFIGKFDMVNKYGSSAYYSPGDYPTAYVGIAFDSQGNLFVSNSSRWEITKFTNDVFVTSGFFNGSCGGCSSENPYFTLDSSNNIWVADAGKNQVQKLDSNYNFIFKFGSAGSGDGQFNTPQGIAIGR